jgi:hypothetical protein
MLDARCNVLYAICYVLYAMCYMQCAVCNVLYAMYYMQCAICNVLYAMYYMQCTICNVLYAMCYMQCAIRLILYAAQYLQYLNAMSYRQFAIYDTLQAMNDKLYDIRCIQSVDILKWMTCMQRKCICMCINTMYWLNIEIIQIPLTRITEYHCFMRTNPWWTYKHMYIHISIII